jgi:hypothetical protein
VAVLEKVCKEMQEELEQTRAIVRAQSSGMRKLIAEVDMLISAKNMGEMRGEVAALKHQATNTAMVDTSVASASTPADTRANLVQQQDRQHHQHHHHHHHHQQQQQPIEELDARVAELLRQLMPSPATAQQRTLLLQYIATLVKKALGTQLFEISESLLALLLL